MKNPAETGRDDPEEQEKAMSETETIAVESSVKKDYKEMTPEDVESYKKWAEHSVALLHDASPDCIFLTESSAVPFGWVLKNCWKDAYPNEASPKFYRTSVTHGVDFNPEEWFQDFWDYFEKRAPDRDKKIIIFDEYERAEENKNGAMWQIRDGQEEPIESKNRTLKKNIVAFKKAGYKNILTFSGGFGLSEHTYGSRQDLELINRMEKELGKKYYIKPTGKNYDKPQLGGRLEKNPELRKRALAYIHDLKLVGKEAGHELRIKLENKK